MASTMSKEERLALAAEKKAARLSNTGDTAPMVEAKEGRDIFQKVASLGAPSTLVMGNSSSGKSTLVRNLVLAKKMNPLWLPLNNTGALTIEAVAQWDTAIPSDWNDFMSGVYKEVMRGTLKYDALVIDGLDVLVGYAVSKEAPSGQAERGDWLRATNHVRDAIVQLRGKFKQMYAILDVVSDKETGGRKLNLNPMAKTVLVPLFGYKFYTHIKRERTADKKLTGETNFTLQRNPDLSTNFIPGDEILSIDE